MKALGLHLLLLVGTAFVWGQRSLEYPLLAWSAALLVKR